MFLCTQCQNTEFWLGSTRRVSCPSNSQSPDVVYAENEWDFYLWTPAVTRQRWICSDWMYRHKLKTSNSSTLHWHTSCNLDLMSAHRLRPQALRVECWRAKAFGKGFMFPKWHVHAQYLHLFAVSWANTAHLTFQSNVTEAGPTSWGSKLVCPLW